MLDITYKMFFDAPNVIKKIKDGTKSVMSKAGAFIRQRAKTSIRPRKGIAKPGQPPSSHDGTLRKLIFFGYDSSTDSVVIGPKLKGGGQSDPTTPHLLEFGGTTKSWRTQKTARYHVFPYMEPALEKEKDKFRDLFQGAVKG